MPERDQSRPALDPAVAPWVEAYRSETARSPAAVEAALERVTASVGGPPPTAATGLSTATKLMLVGAVVAVAAVVAVGSAGPAPIEGTRTAPPVRSVEAPPQRVEAPVKVEPAVAPAEVVEDSPAPEPAVEPSPPARPKRVEGRTKAVVAEPDPPAASGPSSLELELELLARARTALRRGDAREALTVLERHRREFSTGTLAEERDATEVAALCSLGRTDEATDKAAAFARHFPQSTRDVLGDCR